jgi:hypothetical protein
LSTLEASTTATTLVSAKPTTSSATEAAASTASTASASTLGIVAIARHALLEGQFLSAQAQVAAVLQNRLHFFTRSALDKAKSLEGTSRLVRAKADRKGTSGQACK